MSQSLVYIIVNEDALASLFSNWLKENHIESHVFSDLSDLSGMQFQQPSVILVDLKLINNKNKSVLDAFQNEGIPIIVLAQYSNYDIVKNNNYYEICPLPVEQVKFELLISNAISHFNLYQENKKYRNEINKGIEHSTFLTRDHHITEIIQSLKNEILAKYIIIIGEKSVGKTAIINYIKKYNHLNNYSENKIEFVNEEDLEQKLTDIHNSNKNNLILEITTPFPNWQNWDKKIKKVNAYKDAIVYTIPPLRVRPHDIKLYISNFLDDVNNYSYKSIKEISLKAESMLTEYNWPGNIYELHETLKSSVKFATKDYIDESDIALVLKMPEMVNSNDDILINEIISMDEFKEKLIKFAYKKCNGNIYEAATKLKIGRATFYRLLHKYDIL